MPPISDTDEDDDRPGRGDQRLRAARRPAAPITPPPSSSRSSPENPSGPLITCSNPSTAAATSPQPMHETPRARRPPAADEGDADAIEPDRDGEAGDPVIQPNSSSMPRPSGPATPK